MNDISKLDAARFYARAWNTLDASVLESVLNDDVVMESQHVFEPLVGREAVLDYLTEKMETIQRSRSSVRIFAELGDVHGPDLQPCVIVAQGQIDRLEAVVLFKVSGATITRIDICVIPDPRSAKRSGEYPA